MKDAKAVVVGVGVGVGVRKNTTYFFPPPRCRATKRGGKGRDYYSSRLVSSSSSSSSSSPLKEKDDDDDDFDDKEEDSFAALDEKTRRREGRPASSGFGGSSVVAQTTTGAAVDDAAMLSNIGDRTSHKRKEEEFASMLNAAQRYSERNNNDNNIAKKTTKKTPALASGAEDGPRTAEERIAAARGYKVKKKNEKTTNEKDEEENEDDGRRQQKSVNVQIISKDTSYNPFDEDESIVGLDDVETGVNYKPKVSTWGVFPRPKDISKEYGGGRTLKKDEKGQNIIESKEETEARKIRVAKKLEKYRTSNALNMSKEEEEKVREALKDANEFLRVGSVAKGIAVLEPFQQDINARSELGGQVIFCYAMCLDNAQRRDEALKQYKRVLGNQYGVVSKQAERMLWGMTTASKKMKSDLFDYESDRRKFTEDALEKWVNPKWRSMEEDEEEAKKLNEQAIAFAFGLVVLPLMSFVVYLNI
tara:strand:+ start:4326 stop:5750 length:1425 start_codon:yes stop_codon:yes gene_type:complete